MNRDQFRFKRMQYLALHKHDHSPTNDLRMTAGADERQTGLAAANRADGRTSNPSPTTVAGETP